MKLFSTTKIFLFINSIFLTKLPLLAVKFKKKLKNFFTGESNSDPTRARFFLELGRVTLARAERKYFLFLVFFTSNNINNTTKGF